MHTRGRLARGRRHIRTAENAVETDAL